jgi:predicted nucleic acid-binding protein
LKASNKEAFAIDTGVFAEYIVARSPFRRVVERLFRKGLKGDLKLYASSVTVAEVLYVTSRIYREAGLDDPNGEALRYIDWLSGFIDIVNVDSDIALRAGELKKRLRLALPDCIVIATASSIGATPLFRSIEREMRGVLGELRSLGAKFLPDIASLI